MEDTKHKNAGWIKPDVWLTQRTPQSSKPILRSFDRLLQIIRAHNEMTEVERDEMIKRIRHSQ